MLICVFVVFFLTTFRSWSSWHGLILRERKIQRREAIFYRKVSRGRRRGMEQMMGRTRQGRGAELFLLGAFFQLSWRRWRRSWWWRYSPLSCRLSGALHRLVCFFKWDWSSLLSDLKACATSSKFAKKVWMYLFLRECIWMYLFLREEEILHQNLG